MHPPARVNQEEEVEPRSRNPRKKIGTAADRVNPDTHITYHTHRHAHDVGPAAGQPRQTAPKTCTHKHRHTCVNGNARTQCARLSLARARARASRESRSRLRLRERDRERVLLLQPACSETAGERIYIYTKTKEKSKGFAE